MSAVLDHDLIYAKHYMYPYYGLKCIQNFSNAQAFSSIIFKKGLIYPVLSSSLDIYGLFDQDKRLSLISENGYKLSFNPLQAQLFFDTSHLYHFSPKLA